MWSSSKGANPTQLTGTATSKVSPQRDCPRSAHFTPHQVPHVKFTTTCLSSHAVTAIPQGHSIPGFPKIFPQGPTIPLVHSYKSPIHAGLQHRDRGVPIIPPAPAPSKIPKKWEESYCNELGRLCQGIGTGEKFIKKERISVTETFRVIRYEDVPTDRRK